MTFLKELRDAAMKCTRPEYADALRRCADEIADAADQLWKWPTRENMVWLNGAWAKAEAVLKALPPEAEPTPPQSAAGELGRAVRMAA